MFRLAWSVLSISSLHRQTGQWIEKEMCSGRQEIRTQEKDEIFREAEHWIYYIIGYRVSVLTL